MGNYAGQVFSEALERLKGEGMPLQYRLMYAGMALGKLQQAMGNIPEDLRPRYDKIMYELNADPRNSLEGSLKSTADTMTDETARRVAAEITSFNEELKVRGLALGC